ncbi:putative TRL super family protein [Candidatus Termititenax persephonae]|uniref:TRL super family protein n=1 Tax=Candidatus Termititenax persephonae TaxID=2218525 RepID=A0A388THR0_9BACT|nr:putative TRL super family protein [Candidatus Termititenax persephonae]
MKKNLLIMTIGLALLVSQSFAGLLFSNVTVPVIATGSTAVPDKTGLASSYSILGLITIGDAGVKAAVENGGITEVVYVDSNTVSLPFALFVIQTTQVAGK